MIFSNHFQFGRVLSLVNGPGLDRARRQDAEQNSTDCVDSGSDEEHNLPRLTCALQPTFTHTDTQLGDATVSVHQSR